MDYENNNYNNSSPQESPPNLGPSVSYNNLMPVDAPTENFGNLSEFGINVDLILKSIFFGAIFYLLSLPEVYKATGSLVVKRVDGVLLHSVVYAVLYYILVHFI